MQLCHTSSSEDMLSMDMYLVNGKRFQRLNLMSHKAYVVFAICDIPEYLTRWPILDIKLNDFFHMQNMA